MSNFMTFREFIISEVKDKQPETQPAPDQEIPAAVDIPNTTTPTAENPED